MSKQKNQGTRFETWVVEFLARYGMAGPSKDGGPVRHSEGGSKDPGDVIYDAGLRRIDEGKHREQLNPHKTLGEARRKARPLSSALWFKRTVKQEGKSIRTPQGERVIVCCTPEDWAWLLMCERALRHTNPEVFRVLIERHNEVSVGTVKLGPDVDDWGLPV